MEKQRIRELAGEVIMGRMTSIIIGLTAAFGCSTVHAGEIARTARCIPVGIIVESQDTGISNGSEICKDGSISIDADSKVRVLCKLNPNIKWLGAGAHQNNDVCPAYIKPHQCEQGVSCDRGNEKIAILSPKSNVVMSGNHSIEWASVQGATAYRITIANANGDIIASKTTTVPKVDSIGPLVPDEVFRVNIEALNPMDTTISEDSHVLITLASDEIQEIMRLESFIRKQPIAAVERAKYLNSIYESYGVLDQLINIDALQPLKPAS